MQKIKHTSQGLFVPWAKLSNRVAFFGYGWQCDALKDKYGEVRQSDGAQIQYCWDYPDLMERFYDCQNLEWQKDPSNLSVPKEIIYTGGMISYHAYSKMEVSPNELLNCVTQLSSDWGIPSHLIPASQVKCDEWVDSLEKHLK